jgi:hypothetical protein
MGILSAAGAVLGGAQALGSILGGKSQSKAAKRAAEMAQQSTRENNAVAEKFYDRNAQVLGGWQQQGQAANQMFNAALGIPAYAPPQPAAFAPQQYGQPAYAGQAQPSAFMGYDEGAGRGFEAPGMIGGERYMGPYPGSMGQEGAFRPQMAQPGYVQSQAGPSPQDAFSAFRNSNGYQFRQNEGLGALQKAFGRNLNSGAAVKSALRFGQGLASEEYGKWMQLLDNQQRLGFGAASAQAGVNQNMTSTLIGNNNAGTSAAINAKLYGGNAGAQMWQGLGSSFGQMAGMFGR